MTLIQTQKVFPILIAQFINWLTQNGYEITFGEAWRSPETAKLDQQEGKGISNSLHCQRLAFDLNLFKNGVFLTYTKDYQSAGEYWESLSTEDFQCCWGGRFTSRDSDHFSIKWGNVQ